MTENEFERRLPKAIQEAFETGKVLVFPTEVSARTCLDAYVLDTGKPCFADRALSWDRFLESARTMPQGKTKATFAHRLLFAQRFGNSGSCRNMLSHFVPRDCQVTEPFVKTLANSMPHFHRLMCNAEALEALPKDCVKDMGVVLALYAGFLEDNNLYDEDAIVPDFAFAKESHILVYPQTFSDPFVEKALDAGLGTVDVPANCTRSIIWFGNSVEEIRNVMRRILNLMKDGVPSDRIAITCASLDDYKSHLEEEASKRGIRLQMASGAKLDSFPGASVFGKLADFARGGFTFDGFRKIVCDPVIPFKDRGALMDILQQAIENKVTFGSDVWHAKLQSGKLETFRKLEAYSTGFAHAKSFEKMISAFNGFQDDFLAEGSFRVLEDKNQVSVFERCMEELAKLDRMQKDMGIADLDAYNLFSAVLCSTTYTPRGDSSAIKVYSYPVTCPPVADYSFIIGLSDKSAAKSRTKVPFHSSLDGSFEELAGSRDITADVIRAYAQDNQGKVFISFAEDSYAGPSSIPSAFLLENRMDVCRDGIEDSFSREEKAWRHGNSMVGSLVSANQRRWFERAAKTIVPSHLKEYPKAEGKVRLSASAVSEFSKCPYRWLCSYGLGLKDQNLDPVQENALDIGNLIHATYDRFFSKWKHFDSFSSQAAQDDLKAIFEEEVSMFERGMNGPDRLHARHICVKEREVVGAIADKAMPQLAGSTYVEHERSLSLEDDTFKAEGYVDMIMKTPSGGYVVVDFKKNSIDKNSIQLDIYARMLESDGKYAKVPDMAFFYSVEGAKTDVRWTDEEGFKARQEEVAQRIKAFVNAVANGELDPTPSKESCMNCRFRKVCRRRYVIK